jgi:hypothetical protein
MEALEDCGRFYCNNKEIWNVVLRAIIKAIYKVVQAYVDVGCKDRMFNGGSFKYAVTGD